jgi:hypothetical protein
MRALGQNRWFRNNFRYENYLILLLLITLNRVLKLFCRITKMTWANPQMSLLHN